MPSLIVAVLPNIDRCQDVLATWERLGVTGITIVESAGLHGSEADARAAR